MWKDQNDLGEPLWFVLLWGFLSFVFFSSAIILTVTTTLGVAKWILDWGMALLGLN